MSRGPPTLDNKIQIYETKCKGIRGGVFFMSKIQKLYRAYMKQQSNVRKRANFVDADIEIKTAA